MRRQMRLSDHNGRIARTYTNPISRAVIHARKMPHPTDRITPNSNAIIVTRVGSRRVTNERSAEVETGSLDVI